MIHGLLVDTPAELFKNAINNRSLQCMHVHLLAADKVYLLNDDVIAFVFFRSELLPVMRIIL